ncbi:MAG TPA: tetratricopeptide repeat protein [Usitatibacter sp.]|nr:tetratricopeptide repeat protein [Usitatibacter sp.]
MTIAEVTALLANGQRAEALAAAHEGVRANPQDPRWRNTLGAVLIELDRLAEGEQALRDALRLAPDAPEALLNLGVVLRRQGRHEESAQLLARVPADYPHAGRAEWELGQAGVALLLTGRAEAAVRAFQAQLAFRPDSRPAAMNLALAFNALGRHDESARAIGAALAAGHRDAELLAMLVNAKGVTCDWDGIDELIVELKSAARNPGTRPAHPQTAQYLAQVSAPEQKDWALAYCRATFAGLEPVSRRPAPPTTKLRVGFLSSDFREHAVSWLMVGLMEEHDRERFEFHAYSTGPRIPSPVRERIARAVHEFVDCSTVAGRTVAERIAYDGIDVLVDLGGHTQGARLDILAYRAAPVQGHFLGYAGTTGADFVDFFVADGPSVPPGAESSFSERVLRMPRCFMPCDPRRSVPGPALRADHGLREDAIVLCSFNQAVKIRPETFDAWCAMLKSLPNAQLLLRDPGESAKARLASRAAARGVERQIVFAPHLPTREAHMSRLALADIALDTYPYGSHTNAADALWAGVPLVTTRGETFASRVGASLLATAGLSEWAFDDAGKAFDTVIELARDPAKLAAAREKARAARTSALFDAAGFARDFERVLLLAAGRSGA